MLNPSPDTGIDSIFNLNTKSTSLIDIPVTTIAKPPLLSATTPPLPPTPLITHLQQTPVPTPATVPSSSQQDIPNFGSLFGFDHRLKTLENDFSKFNQTNQFTAAVASIPGIVDTLKDEAQAKNEDFLNKHDENIKKIIKDQVKEQVKAQVSKILPKIKKTVNEQLEVEVQTRSPNESKTSYDVAANVSKLELKKILIDNMESNKSIHRSDKQKNLYKALVDAYESDKLILDTYGDTRRRAGKEPESTGVPKVKNSKTTGKSTKGSKSHHKSAGESAQAEEPRHTTNSGLGVFGSSHTPQGCVRCGGSHDCGLRLVYVIQQERGVWLLEQPWGRLVHEFAPRVRSVWVLHRDRIQSGVISYTFIFFPSILLEPSMGILGDDDNFLLTMHGLPKPVSWLGSHIKSLIAAMYNENNEGLQQLLELRNYTNNDVLLLHPEDEDVISVAAFVASWITVGLKAEQCFEKKIRVYGIVCAIITCPPFHQESESFSLDVPKIFMHQFWYTIKKVKDSESYEFLLANKKCIVNAKVFRKILDICQRVEGEEFTPVQDDDDTLTFLTDLGYKGPLYKHNNMFVDHMHQPWRTLAAIINKCLSEKTASNDKLRKSRIDILWGMFYRENVDPNLRSIP
ncbi:hypothetical protein Tco_0817709 [Tanacetum coccineum]